MEQEDEVTTEANFVSIPRHCGTTYSRPTILIAGILIAVNGTLGALLWFGFSSAYSWRTALWNYAFTVFVLVVASVSIVLRKRYRIPFSEGIWVLACAPSFIGASWAIILEIMFLLPPFWLGAMFDATERASEIRLQETVSPDGQWVVEVTFRSVGAYARGTGRVSVVAHPKYFPFIAQDVAYVSPSYADENDKNYVVWKDDRTLKIVGEKDFGHRYDPNPRVGGLGLRLPSPFRATANLIRLVVMLFLG